MELSLGLAGSSSKKMHLTATAVWFRSIWASMQVQATVSSKPDAVAAGDLWVIRKKKVLL